jgi:electron transport complex protein RnfG
VKLNLKLKVKIDPLVKSILVLFAVTLISAITIAITNNITADVINNNNRHAREEARQNIGEFTFAFEVSSKGYGGDITMIVGISSIGDVTGVAIIEMNETLGVGTRTLDPDFLEQFIGKRSGVSVGRGANNVDAVAGATVSSRAIAAGVNDALDMYAEIVGGGH